MSSSEYFLSIKLHRGERFDCIPVTDGEITLAQFVDVSLKTLEVQSCPSINMLTTHIPDMLIVCLMTLSAKLVLESNAYIFKRSRLIFSIIRSEPTSLSQSL